MEVELTDYRIGILIGVFGYYGFSAVLQGSEVLLFNGLAIEWTPEHAVLSILLGVALLLIAGALHQWWTSIQTIQKLEYPDAHSE